MNGRLKPATFVLLHLTGAAVGFAGLLIGSKRFIDGVEKAKMSFGVPLSKCNLEVFPTQEDLWLTGYILQCQSI